MTGVTAAETTPVDRAHVLVVDDAASVRELFARYLAWSGLDVTIAADGEAGLAQARARTPDIVVCDIEMPNMDGVALCLALRSETATAAMPILVVSGGYEFFQAARDAGCSAVLAKPCPPAQLLSAIRELLSPSSAS